MLVTVWSHNVFYSLIWKETQYLWKIIYLKKDEEL